MRAAEAAYREGLADKDPNAAFQLGIILHDRGDVHGAIQAYEFAAERGDIEAKLNLANMLADELDRPEDAIRLYKEVIATGDPRGFIDLGIVFERGGNLEAAEREYRKAINAGEPRGHVKLGYLRKLSGLDQEAEVEYRRALGLGVEEVWAYLGWHLADLDRVEEAEEVFRQGIAAEDFECLRGLGSLFFNQRREREAEEVYRAAVKSGDPDPEAAYRLAEIMENCGEYETAAELYERSIAQGEDEYAPLDLAKLYANELDRPDDAEKLICDALDRGNRQAFVNLGALRAQQQRLDEAEEALRQAIEADAPYAHLHMGRVLVAKGQDEQAVAEYLRASEEDLDADDWKHIGWELLAIGFLGDAERMFRHGLSAGDLENYKFLGRVLYESGRPDEAERLFEEALAKGQHDVLTEYGILLKDRERLGRAEQVLREARDHGDNDAHYELAQLYRGMGRLDEAEHEYQAAIVAEDDEAHRAYGTMLLDAGRLAEAERQLELAVQRGDRKAVATLADLYQRTGRADKLRALRDGPRNETE